MSVVGVDKADTSHPTYSVELPDGWTPAPGGHFVINERSNLLGFGVWDVVQVPADPCLWKSTLNTPGPSVDELVQALLAQHTRNPTTPRQIAVDGYSGSYLEWSVPADSVVTGDADFAGCDDPGNGHHDFVSWFGAGGSERYEQVAGQIDHLWVLDVNGTRLVIDDTAPADANPADLAELDQLAQSVRFEAP